MSSADDTVVYMFDDKLLEGLDISEYGIECNGSDGKSYLVPSEGLLTRPLSTKDYHKGFVDVLNQLTRAGDITYESFMERFNAMKKVGDYYPIVIEDTNGDSGRGRVIATGTLIVEQKFIHSCATRGRVEEVVVDSAYRGQKLGKLILALVTSLSRKLGCYKTTLECKLVNIDFYGKFGYIPDAEKFMQCRFRD